MFHPPRELEGGTAEWPWDLSPPQTPGQHTLELYFSAISSECPQISLPAAVGLMSLTRHSLLRLTEGETEAQPRKAMLSRPPSEYLTESEELAHLVSPRFAFPHDQSSACLPASQPPASAPGVWERPLPEGSKNKAEGSVLTLHMSAMWPRALMLPSLSLLLQKWG